MKMYHDKSVESDVLKTHIVPNQIFPSWWRMDRSHLKFLSTVPKNKVVILLPKMKEIILGKLQVLLNETSFTCLAISSSMMRKGVPF